jgi:hypothetical protein
VNRAVCFTLIGLAVVVVAVGCGERTSSELETWASNVCLLLSDQEAKTDAIYHKAERVSRRHVGREDLGEIYDAEADYAASRVVEASRKFAAKLKEFPPPPDGDAADQWRTIVGLADVRVQDGIDEVRRIRPLFKKLRRQGLSESSKPVEEARADLQGGLRFLALVPFDVAVLVGVADGRLAHSLTEPGVCDEMTTILIKRGAESGAQLP